MGGASGGSGNPEPVDRLIDAFKKLPGIGQRSAERMAFHILKAPRDEAKRLSQAVLDVKDKVAHCSICSTLTERDPCRICIDERRDASVVLVVEQPRDVLAIEQTGLFRGIYHVLTGQIDPLGGIEPEDLTIPDLLARIDDPRRNARGEKIREVILGLNPTLEGDSTGLYLAEALQQRGLAVSRLARGLAAGSQIEYATPAMLADALEGRHRLSDPGAG